MQILIYHAIISQPSTLLANAFQEMLKCFYSDRAIGGVSRQAERSSDQISDSTEIPEEQRVG